MAFVWFILAGAAAGWITSELLKGTGFGPVGNLLIGIIGAVIGGPLSDPLGITPYGLAGSLLTAVIGAALLLAAANTLARRTV